MIATVERSTPAESEFGRLAALWATADALPRASVVDFRDKAQYREEFASSLRLIDDHALRAELIRVRMAQPVDVTPGRRPRTCIIRLTPNLSEPTRRPRPRVALRRPRPTRARSAPAQSLVTVEELRDLLDAISDRESAHLADLNTRIAALRADVSVVEGERLYACVATLHRLLEELHTTAPLSARRAALADLGLDAGGTHTLGLRIRSAIGPVDTESADESENAGGSIIVRRS